MTVATHWAGSRRAEQRRRHLAAVPRDPVGTRLRAYESREIAQNPLFSHGVHYYSNDKRELMSKCVELYAERAAQRYSALAGTDHLELGRRLLLAPVIPDPA